MKTFISYCHEDKEWYKKLKTHVASLVNYGQISIWSDHEIRAGEEIEQKIKEELSFAELFILIVSPHYLASDACMFEFDIASKRLTSKDLKIVPILVEPCDWESIPKLKKLKITPDDAKPVSTWKNENTAFVTVVNEIRRIITDWEDKSHRSKNLKSKKQDTKVTSLQNTQNNNPISLNSSELVTQLKQGKKNFSGITIRNANLSGFDLQKVDFTNANLSGANFKGADLSNANLEFAELTAANFEGANISDAKLVNAILFAANLIGANITGSNLTGADLVGCEMYCANLWSSNLERADLTGADLTGANLIRAKLRKANLNEINLRCANLWSAELTDANLFEANLSGANLIKAILRGTNLKNSILNSTNLSFADLTEANVSGANLTNIILNGAKTAGVIGLVN